MYEASVYLVDEAGVPYWDQKVKDIAAQIQLQDDRERFSGSPIAIKVS